MFRSKQFPLLCNSIQIFICSPGRCQQCGPRLAGPEPPTHCHPGVLPEGGQRSPGGDPWEGGGQRGRAEGGNVRGGRSSIRVFLGNLIPPFEHVLGSKAVRSAFVPTPPSRRTLRTAGGPNQLAKRGSNCLFFFGCIIYVVIMPCHICCPSNRIHFI